MCLKAPRPDMAATGMPIGASFYLPPPDADLDVDADDNSSEPDDEDNDAKLFTAFKQFLKTQKKSKPKAKSTKNHPTKTTDIHTHHRNNAPPLELESDSSVPRNAHSRTKERTQVAKARNTKTSMVFPSGIDTDSDDEDNNYVQCKYKLNNLIYNRVSLIICLH